MIMPLKSKIFCYFDRIPVRRDELPLFSRQQKTAHVRSRFGALRRQVKSGSSGSGRGGTG